MRIEIPPIAPGNLLESEAVTDHRRVRPQIDRLQTLLVPEVATPSATQAKCG